MHSPPGGNVIARIWHGVTLATKADKYVGYLKETGLADYAAADGNRGVYLLRRIEGDWAHFMTLTFWESEKAIQAFAGVDIEKARYYPEDKEFLLEFEPTVKHYQVVHAAPLSLKDMQ
jgi:heme-degrading monooxygenase HmoA